METLTEATDALARRHLLIFALRRLDVWPVDDLAVRNGYAKVFGMAETRSARQLGPLGDRFRPYRTVMTLYCRQDLETVLPD